MAPPHQTMHQTPHGTILNCDARSLPRGLRHWQSDPRTISPFFTTRLEQDILAVGLRPLGWRRDARCAARRRRGRGDRGTTGSNPGRFHRTQSHLRPKSPHALHPARLAHRPGTPTGRHPQPTRGEQRSGLRRAQARTGVHPSRLGREGLAPLPPTSPEAYARGRSPASRQPTWQSPLCPAPRRRSLAQPQCPSPGPNAAKIRRKSSRSWSCPPSTGRCSPPSSSPWNASG